jgi:hypothetical protein
MFGRLVFWMTRAVTVVALATQAALLGIELTWARQHHTPIGVAAGRQSALLAATALLATVAFWSTAQHRRGGCTDA